MNPEMTSIDPNDLSPASLFGSLPIARYRMAIHLSKPIPGHMGSAWRGLIGWSLQRLICPFARKPECKPCIVRKHCPYFRLFEDQSPVSGILEMPRGYILSPTDSGQSCTHDLEITLIGDCIRSFPAVAQALHAGKSTGLGPSRIPYQVAGMSEVSPDGTVTRLSVAAGDGIGMGAAASLSDWLAASPAITGNMDVSFLTPFRLKKQGKYLGQMDWSHYFATLVRRLESLNCLFFDGASIGKKRYQKLIQQFSEVSAIRQDLSWLDYNRYSNRQHKKVPMGGLVGTARLSQAHAWVAPWLQAAELVHVGKGASMGLGKIVVGRSE